LDAIFHHRKYILGGKLNPNFKYYIFIYYLGSGPPNRS